MIMWLIVIQTSSASSGIGFGIKGKPVSSDTFDNLRAAVNSVKTGEFAGNSILSLTESQVPNNAYIKVVFRIFSLI